MGGELGAAPHPVKAARHGCPRLRAGLSGCSPSLPLRSKRRGREGPWGGGCRTHVVSLVEVHRAGDRCETLIPVMTIPVHSGGHTGGGGRESGERVSLSPGGGEGWVNSHSRAPGARQGTGSARVKREVPLPASLKCIFPGGMCGKRGAQTQGPAQVGGSCHAFLPQKERTGVGLQFPG